jgi:hypothetical protein
LYSTQKDDFMDGMHAAVIAFCRRRYWQAAVSTPYQAEAYLLILKRANELDARRMGAERQLFDFLVQNQSSRDLAKACQEVLAHLGK